MFDLNEEISKWRKTMAQNQTCEASDLDELQSHLIEEIDQLKAHNLSEQEAFWVAIHRLGAPDALTKEFAKVNESLLWQKRLFWGVVGILSYLGVFYISGAFSKIFSWLASRAGLGGYTLGVLETLSSIVLFGLFVLLLYVICKRGWAGRLFYKFTADLKGRIVLLAGVLLMTAVVSATRIFMTAMVARTTSAKEFGQVVMVSAYLRLGLLVLVPIVLMILLIKLHLTSVNYNFSSTTIIYSLQF